MNKNKILSIFTLFVMIGSISFADNNLKTIENQEIVLSSEVDQYKNTVKNEIISDGIKYKLKNIEQSENKKNVTRDKEIEQTLIVTNNNKNTVLKLFENTKNFSEDGYMGILELEKDSLQIRANESYTEEYKETIQKTYNNVSQNELNNIPKQVTENGVTYYLVNPIWNIASTKEVDLNKVPETYNGVMNYETIKQRTKVKNYKATIKYKGTLQKEVVDSITFTTTYEEIPQEEPIQEVQSNDNYIGSIIVGTTGGIIIYSGIILLKRKNVKILKVNEDNTCKVMKRTNMNEKKLIIDITPVIIDTNKYRIELSNSIFEKVKGKNVTVKYFDKQFIIQVNEKVFEIEV